MPACRPRRSGLSLSTAIHRHSMPASTGRLRTPLSDIRDHTGDLPNSRVPRIDSTGSMPSPTPRHVVTSPMSVNLKALGPIGGGAVKFTGRGEGATGLGVAEGIETVL